MEVDFMSFTRNLVCTDYNTVVSSAALIQYIHMHI